MSSSTGRIPYADASRNAGEPHRTETAPARVVVLISGRGSNMMALVENSHDGKAERSNPSTPLNCRKNAYSVTRIISDNPTASGLLWAQERGLNTVALPDRGSFSSKKEFYSYLLDRVLEVSPTLICLAGFMKVLPPVLIAPLFPKIINIHPSLLPAFPGLNTHERALAANATRHGCSIHVVVPEIDAGPIVAQAAVDIEPNDSPESLSERVLKIEHGIYPWVVSMICCGEILLGERVSFSELARAEASSRGYLLPPA